MRIMGALRVRWDFQRGKFDYDLEEAKRSMNGVIQDYFATKVQLRLRAKVEQKKFHLLKMVSQMNEILLQSNIL